MNKNKIISTILISSMLADIVPVVNVSALEIENIIESEFTESEVVEKESTKDVSVEDVTETESIENDSSNIVDSVNKENIFIEDTNSDTPAQEESVEEEDTSNESVDNNFDEILSDEDFDINEGNPENKIPNEEIADDKDFEVDGGDLKNETPNQDISEDAIAIDSTENSSGNELNKSIVINGDVIEVTLGEDEYVPDLAGNPNGYTTIKIITTGNKKLVSTDYRNLRNSEIPNIDLSNAKSDSIPNGAFANATHLKTFKFPKDVKFIGVGARSAMDGTFYNCINLATIIISDTVTTIGPYAFYKCSGFTGDLVIPNSVTSIGNYAFLGCSGFTGNLAIPDSVTTIGVGVFNNCSGFTGDLVIPDSVTSIGDSAFYGCSGFSGSLTIPNSVTSIEDRAFYGCSGFTGDLTIPDSVTSLGYEVFYNCSGFTGNLVIGNSVTSIGRDAFEGCSGFTGDLVIPDSVTLIGRNAFQDCSGFTGDLIIGNSVTLIESSAFRGCSGFTGNLVIGNSVTRIGYYAFRDCIGFTGDLLIPNSVTTIGIEAFRGCSGFTGNLIVGNSVTSIDNYAFYNCSGFTGNLVIGNSVTTIGSYVFYNCSGFTGNLIIPNSVTTIGSAAFKNCSGFIGNLVIPDSITKIDSHAFDGCRGFTGDLIIPDSVTSVSTNAFSGCSGFTGDLIIGNSVTSIDGLAFADCSGFTGNLIIGDSVTSIGYYAFKGCSGFTGDLVIPNSVTSIDNNAFSSCKNINRFIFRVDKSFGNSDYRKNVFYSLPTGKVVVEMPYDFDTSGAWLESLNENQNGKPKIKSESTTVNGDENTSVSLRIPTPYKEENITILKDGEYFDLPQKNNNEKYIFNEEGIYNITIKTDLGTVSDIDFKIVGWVNKPTIEYNDALISILDNGHHIYESVSINEIENFDDISNIKYTFSNNNWEIINGTLKSQSITHSQSTENSFKINAQKDDKLKISVRVSSESGYDKGYIYLNGKEVYSKSGNNSTYDTVELDLIEGENIIKFKYQKDSSDSKYEDAMFIDSMELSGYRSGLTNIDRIEYRLNNGEWIEYLGSFRIPDELVNGLDEIKVEARIIVKDKVSKTTEYSLTIPKAQLNVENTEFTQGDNFDEYSNVSATDIDGNDISDRITVMSSDVKTDIPGEYTILYRVEASNGYFTEKEIKVTVVPLVINKPTIKYENNIVAITDNGNNSTNSLNKVEYRINSGEWIEYSSEFRIPDHFVNGVDSIKIETRAVARDKSSDITTESIKVLKAEIITEDIEITEGDSFDELDYVKAIDIDGVDISDKVTVASSNVKIDTPGEYTVVYKVEASNGYFTEKEVKVTVLKKKLPPIINANKITLNQGSKFNPLDLIPAIDEKGNLIDKSKVEIVENTVNTAKPGKYIIVYRIKDNNDFVTTKTIDIIVKEASYGDNNNDSNNADSNNGNSSDNSNNSNSNNSNGNKIPNTGGNATFLYLSSIMSIIGGLSFIGKRKVE